MSSILKVCIFICVALLSISQVFSSDSDLRAGEVRMGSYGYKCTSRCEKKGGTSYYWCDAVHPIEPYKGDSYWDYCSKEDEFTSDGDRCYIEHACGNHGYRYKWCYTNEGKTSWGYCGYKVRTNRS